MSVYIEPTRADFWQLAKEPGSSQYLDPLGPKDCMTHSAARAVMRACEGHKPAGAIGVWPPTGYEIRRHCIDPSTGKADTSGGVNHTQVRAAVKHLYGVELELHYGERFDDILDMGETTHGIMFSVWYRRIRDSDTRRGSYTFYQNHELWVPAVDRDRGFLTGVVEPLADGRQPGLYHGPGNYPISLIKAAAGELNVARTGYRALGAGLCYAMTTIATGAAPAAEARWRIHIPARAEYGLYEVRVDERAGMRRIAVPHKRRAVDDISNACTKPYPVLRRTVNESLQLVKLDRPGSDLDNLWVSADYARRVA